jgi:alkaline phosphatase D
MNTTMLAFVRILAFCGILLCVSIANAQQSQLISGPMLGQVELRTAKIWIEVKPGAKVELSYWKSTQKNTLQKIRKSSNVSDWFGAMVFDLVGLDIGSEYQYEVRVAGRQSADATGTFRTKDLWEHRKPAPDFSFLAGSCAYNNEPVFDRPGNPYGSDSLIFASMAKEKADFMIWLGDNWYTREVDFFSQWGLWYRAHHDRAAKILQPLLKKMSHFATWDDHDYGPNNADKSYVLKEESRKVFMNYWANPSYGLDGKGVYTRISYSDVDFFLMDDRYFRSADNLTDSVNGKPNAAKRMWGAEQMEWLKNSLKTSYGSFKVIVNGSQVVNPLSSGDGLVHYPVEYAELINFIREQDVWGVVFLTGDVHRSEVMKIQPEGLYPLYDITSSPLTAGVFKARNPQPNNARVPNTLVEQHNYAKISVTGNRNERVLSLQYLDVNGSKISEFSISQDQLRPRK